MAVRREKIKWEPISKAPTDGSVIRARGWIFGEKLRGSFYANARYVKGNWLSLDGSIKYAYLVEYNPKYVHPIEQPVVQFGQHIEEAEGRKFWRLWKEEYSGQGLRLGQAFCNHFKLSTKQSEKLFYETDESKARNSINAYLAHWQAL